MALFRASYFFKWHYLICILALITPFIKAETLLMQTPQATFPYQLVDLTHRLHKEMPSWTGRCGFHTEIKLDYDLESKEPSFRVQQLKMHAGIGTHMDAPAHCSTGKQSVDDLPLENFLAPCVVIDVSALADASYRLTVSEMELFEKKYGMIAPGSFVVIRTGWEKYWKGPERYHNNYVFPSISGEAAQFLLKRDIVGLGIDTLSPDKPSDGFPVHAALLGAEKYIIENIANAEKLPPKGSWTLAAPLNIEGGTEAPLRLVGLLPASLQ